jgi:hypothetical protein
MHVALQQSGKGEFRQAQPGAFLAANEAPEQSRTICYIDGFQEK